MFRYHQIQTLTSDSTWIAQYARADAVEQKRLVSGLVPRHLLPPSSEYVELWWGWIRRACSNLGAGHPTSGAQFGDTLGQVPATSQGDINNESPGAVFSCLTACTVIPHAAPSLDTEGNLSGSKKLWFQDLATARPRTERRTRPQRLVEGGADGAGEAREPAKLILKVGRKTLSEG